MAVWSLDCTVFFGLISSQKETNIWYNYINIGNKKTFVQGGKHVGFKLQKAFQKAD
jgi:hypothetical protein